MTKYCGVVIMGGLGNKLFQIAHMLGYSRKHDFIPCLHSNFITNNHQTTVKWDYFIRDLKMEKYLGDIINEPIYKAGEYQVYPNFERNVIFNGYFQSEKYFKHCEDEIYEKFKCSTDFEILCQNNYPDIKDRIFLHIRRGDNIGSKFHYIDLTKFYQEAIKHFGEDSPYLIFSDDIEYCQNDPLFKNLKNVLFVPSRYNEIESLWLMSLCGRGGICANSTFSWWGSWLALKRYGNQCQIIFPEKMFPHDMVSYPDLYLKQFITM